MPLINYVTRVQFGFGELATLKEELALAGISRPLVVTDKGVRGLGFLDKIEAVLGKELAGVYDETPATRMRRPSVSRRTCSKRLKPTELSP